MVTEKLQLQICVICNHYMWLLGVCVVTSAREDCHFFLWVLLASSSLTYCLGLTAYHWNLVFIVDLSQVAYKYCKSKDIKQIQDCMQKTEYD